MLEDIVSIIFQIGIPLMILLGVVLYIISTINRLRSRNVLGVLTLAVRHELPMPELLRTQSREIGWKRGERLDELGDLLQQGVSLPAALATCHNLLTPRSALAIRVGGECGLLKEAFESELHAEQHEVYTKDFAYYYNFIYTCTVIYASLVTSTYLLYFVLPKFKEIMVGFGLLDTQQWGMAVYTHAQPLVDMYILPIFLLGTIVYVCALVWLLQDDMGALMRIKWLRAPFAPAWIVNKYTFGWLIRLTPRRANERLLRYLALSAEKQQPLGLMIDSLARHDPDEEIRKRLGRVRAGLESGAPLWELLNKHRFLNADEAATLQAAESNRQLAPALRDLSREQTGRQIYRTLLSFEWGRFVLLIALAAWGGILASIVWGTLINLIHGVANTPPM